MNWEKLLNRNRLRSPPGKTKRLTLDEFFVDEDSIIFSQPFRRMKDKTQVHPLSDNDHVRTRLTHSLEVSSIGHALGALTGQEIVSKHGLGDIRANDVGRIVKAACLAHDIGNPPFGHIGEQAIEQWFTVDGIGKERFRSELSKRDLADFEKFDGNAQGLRILTNKENYKNDGGLRLTFATLGSLIKYPWGSSSALADAGKFGFFRPEKEYVIEIADALGLKRRGDSEWCRHPLAYLVEAADDICYSVIDLEDGIEIGAITFATFEEQIWEYLRTDRDSKTWKRFYGGLDEPAQKVSYLRSKVIIVMAEQVKDVFVANEKELLEGRFTGSLLDKCDGGSFIQALKDKAEHDVFPNSKKRFLEIASYTVLHGLLDDFSQAVIKPRKTLSKKEEFLLSLMGRDAPIAKESTYQRLRKVVDFVSGMTDRYALEMYRQLRGISAGGTIRPPLLMPGI